MKSPAEPSAGGAPPEIVLDGLSKFYGETLGVNRVTLRIPPGITSLVGPNGSGKTTLMSLLTGLLRPTRGSVLVRGLSPDQPERFFSAVGFCTQYDSFPRGATGIEFVANLLRLHGLSREAAAERAWRAIERLGMTDAARRRIAGYSKGMRQRIKLAQAIAHDPAVVVLDEPLNGLDPMARAEVIGLLQEWGREGRHVLLSSHVLHEVDLLSDRVIILHGGYVAAEGEIRAVRGEMTDHPLRILIRCDRPEVLAAQVFRHDTVVSVRLHDDRRGLLVSTRDADRFYLVMNRIVLEEGLEVETVAPADDDVNALYQYLIGEGEEVP